MPLIWILPPDAASAVTIEAKEAVSVVEKTIELPRTPVEVSVTPPEEALSPLAVGALSPGTEAGVVPSEDAPSLLAAAAPAPEIEVGNTKSEEATSLPAVAALKPGLGESVVPTEEPPPSLLAKRAPAPGMLSVSMPVLALFNNSAAASIDALVGEMTSALTAALAVAA